MCSYFSVNLFKIVHNQITMYNSTAKLVFFLLYSTSRQVKALRARMTFFWDRIDSFFVQFFSLAWARSIHLLFSPFYSSVLEPDLNLCFCQIKRGGEVMSLRSHHVLLSIKFFLQSLELFGCENCANSLRLSLFEIPGFVFFMMNNW